MALVNSDECMARPTNLVRDVNADGESRIQVGNIYTEVHNYNEPNRNRCIADLRLTDPRDDKARIEQTKGGLLKDSYKWVLDHEDFRRWRDDRDSRLLWIKGDAGKGKTMLLCGIIDELSQSRAEITNVSKGGLFGNVAAKRSRRSKKMLRRFKTISLSPTHSHPLSFFICQGTDSRLNHATAVLRGLMYLLLCQQPSLISHIQDRYDHAGRRLFEDTNAFYTLSQALASMLCDAKGCYMVVDALDECEMGLPQLLCFIVQTASAYAHVKWIVSSRNHPDIEQELCFDDPRTRLSLELNAQHVTQAINIFIDYKISELVSLKGDKSLQDKVRHEMQRKASGTVLWAALVAQELRSIQPWDMLGLLEQRPSGLLPLYHRMMEQIEKLQPEYRGLCRLVLSTAAIAYQPLLLCALGLLSGLPAQIARDSSYVQRVIDMCGSFLTIRNDHVYLIHQSVKDFLTTEASVRIFQHGFAAAHHTMFLKSIQIMSNTLRHNMYHLHHPGTSINDVRQPEPDPLAPARYSCFYWADHLRDAISHGTSRPIDDLHDDGTVYKFLSKKYLYWLEALSLLRAMPKGVVAMTKLLILLEESDKSRLFDLVRDARRFILSHGWAIGNAPLQAFASALIFSPRRCLIRNLFAGEEPDWIVIKPAMAEDWDACMTTLEGHSGYIESLAFSPDGQYLSSASWDKTVKIWDTTTGHCHATLEGHGDTIYSVAFSPNGQHLASASRDKTIKIWDIRTRHCQAILEGHGGAVRSVSFSPDGGLASASLDGTVKIWDIRTGHCQEMLKGNGNRVYLVAFSLNGQYLASTSLDGTVKIWDISTGNCQATLEGHGDSVQPVAFSLDGQYLASTSRDRTVKIWDITTGHCQATLNVGRTLNTIRFDEISSRLLTDAGIFDLSMLSASPSPTAALPASGFLYRPVQRQGYGISADGEWITYQGRNLLWLPSEYRPAISAIAASTVALGCSSGPVLLLRFSGEAPR